MSPADVLRTSPADVTRTSLYGLIHNTKGSVLPTSLYGSIRKAGTLRRDKDTLTTKIASTARQVDNTKGRNINYVS